MCNIAVISVHTSPLAVPGTRDSGGMNVYIRELSREMGKRAHTMDIFTRRSDADSPEVVQIDQRTRVIQIDAGPLDAGKTSLRQHLPDFADGVLAFQRRDGREYDLIHSHYWLSGQVGRRLKAAWGVPHVTMFHTLGEAKNRHHLSEHEPQYRIDAEGEVAHAVDRVICASEGERELLMHYYGTPRSRVSVVPCGADTEYFRPGDREAARAKIGLTGDEPVVLFVGRIEPLKGIDILLRAAAIVEACYQLVILGGDAKDADRKRELMELARDLGVCQRIHFIDAVPHNELPAYYSAADVCVVPSYYESFGLVAVEAMACGVPVIASRVGGLKDTVKDGRTGYLVAWRCPEPFAEKLELLLSNESLRRSMGREAREVAQRYHWSKVAESVEYVYHGLVSAYRGETVGAHVA
jgi:D-inositol-3-phosphate glycosyltransferase